MTRKALILGIGVIAATLSTGASADIVGSAHDFTPYGWSDGQICKPCHTPHHSITSVERAPLWNHELTVATYTLHDGTSGNATDDLDGRSVLCMSCHDGTVALDSFGGNTGVQYILGDALLGTDLQDDHPLGSQGIYPDPPPSWFRNKNTFPSSIRLEDMIVDGNPVQVVSCTTCHEPHKRGNFEHMLRISNSGSALCLTCHIK